MGLWANALTQTHATLGVYGGVVLLVCQVSKQFKIRYKFIRTREQRKNLCVQHTTKRTPSEWCHDFTYTFTSVHTHSRTHEQQRIKTHEWDPKPNQIHTLELTAHKLHTYARTSNVNIKKPSSSKAEQQASKQRIKGITSCFSVFDTKTQYFFLYYNKRRALTVCFF